MTVPYTPNSEATTAPDVAASTETANRLGLSFCSVEAPLVAAPERDDWDPLRLSLICSRVEQAAVRTRLLLPYRSRSCPVDSSGGRHAGLGVGKPRTRLSVESLPARKPPKRLDGPHRSSSPASPNVSSSWSWPRGLLQLRALPGPSYPARAPGSLLGPSGGMTRDASWMLSIRSHLLANPRMAGPPSSPGQHFVAWCPGNAVMAMAGARGPRPVAGRPDGELLRPPRPGLPLLFRSVSMPEPERRGDSAQRWWAVLARTGGAATRRSDTERLRP
jgi:hypothetical protein